MFVKTVPQKLMARKQIDILHKTPTCSFKEATQLQLTNDECALRDKKVSFSSFTPKSLKMTKRVFVFQGCGMRIYLSTHYSCYKKQMNWNVKVRFQQLSGKCWTMALSHPTSSQVCGSVSVGCMNSSHCHSPSSHVITPSALTWINSQEKPPLN